MMPTGQLVATGVVPPALARRHPAVKLGGLFLALLGWLLAPTWCLPLLAAAQLGLLWWCGISPAALVPAVRPWLVIALLVLGVHSLTTVSAAPLGQPSWVGLGRGVIALARVAGSVAGLACYLRIAPLTDLVGGVSWWLRPAQRLGLDTTRLSLVIAVALGTIPLVLARGRRIEATLRLRQHSARHPASSRRSWWRRILVRGHLIIPLVEDLFRRAEGLTLSLQNRLPPADLQLGRPGAWEGLGLVAWTLLLVLVLWI
jgi:energy-coupling factor transporter transmembrane protein EcfT